MTNSNHGVESEAMSDETAKAHTSDEFERDPVPESALLGLKS